MRLASGMWFSWLIAVLLFAAPCAHARTAATEVKPGAIVAVPNMHGTVSGWLTDFNRERNYMANNYAANLLYLAQDPDYVLAISEVPNLIALEELRPDVLPILRDGLKSGRVELVNAFFDETDANLLLGETLIRSAVEGIGWQKEHYGVTPRFGWMIDSNGMHSQFAEILSQIGIDSFIYFRNSPVDSYAQRWRSPSGAEALGLANNYQHWQLLYGDEPRIDRSLVEAARPHFEALPKDAPLLWLLSKADYSPAPADPKMVQKLLAAWNGFEAGRPLQFALPSALLDFYRGTPEIMAQLPVITDGTIFSYNAFWAAAPRAKQAFRAAEEGLIAAESLAALASVARGTAYPACDLRDAWWTLLMNSDRALVWGAGSGDPYYGANTWNVEDRNRLIADRISKIEAQSLPALVEKSPDHITILNPAGVERYEVFALPAAMAGKQPENLVCEKSDDGMRCAATIKPFSALTVPLKAAEAATTQAKALPASLQTPYYDLAFDKAGRLVSLKTKNGARPLLLGEDIRAERQKVTPGQSDFLVARDKRETIQREADAKGKTTIRETALGWHITREFTWANGSGKNGAGGKPTKITRETRFYRDNPRIDIRITATDLPNDVLISDNFRLPGLITTERRAIPYGFTSRKLPRVDKTPQRNLLGDHHEPYGVNDKSTPVVRWSAHEMTDGSGVAVLDRGVPGRETNGNEITVMLNNTASTYRGKPNEWLRGDGTSSYEYSLLPYSGDWTALDLPGLAAGFNAPLSILEGVAGEAMHSSLLQSSDNFLIQSVRLTGKELEVRGVETKGKEAKASISLNLPYQSAHKTNALGEKTEGSKDETGGTVNFDVKPQQIVTFRFATNKESETCASLTSLESLIPADKRDGLKISDPTLVGHPPE